MLALRNRRVAKDRMLERQARLSRERLLEVLSYDPATGVFRWLVSTSNRIKIGAVAGQLIKGARWINVDGTRFAAHRLAWFYVKTVWPDGDIDHHDVNPDNNIFVNLREAFGGQNHCNCRVRKHCRSGVKGAHWHSQAKRWTSRISLNKKHHYLGLFDTVEEAAAAYAEASARFHGEFGRTY